MQLVIILRTVIETREVNNTWEKYDDFQSKIKTVRPTTETQNCQCLMYTK